MFTAKIPASAFVISCALAGAQAYAQQTASPAADAVTSAPESTGPAPAEPAASAQPNTTAVPASEPAATPQASAAPADPATRSADAAAPTEPSATAPVPTQQAEATPAQPASANPQVMAFVDAQFPALDADKDGALTTTEFEGWISKLKMAELEKAGKPVNAQEVKSYAQNALKSADRDSDKKVTKAEATEFFSGAA